MKILQVINGLGTGGAEKLLLETIPLYFEKGIKVDLLVLNGQEFPYLTELKKLNCCSIFSLGNGSLYNPIHVFKIIPFMSRYDLIHVHLFPAQYWVAFAKFLSFSRTKFVFTEHSTSNRRIQNDKFKYIERFVYSFFDKIVCITENVKNVFLIHTNLSENRFQVIENGVNLSKIKEAKSLKKESLNPSILESDKLIIQVAGFRSEKDQKTVIRALTYLDSNFKLILVGDGELINECKDLVAQLELNDRVSFLGVRTDVASLLKTADISVVSSHWEGFGLAAVEGMAAEKPLLASNVDGLADVVGRAEMLFEKGNERELAFKIKEILGDKTLYNKLVDTGLKRAQKYDIKSMVDEHINMYENLVKT